MKVFVTGATGFIGSALCAAMKKRGYELCVLARNPRRAREILGDDVECVESLYEIDSLDGFDCVVNLCGENIADKRWSAARKEVLCQSRWQATEKLARLIKNSKKPPKIFISGSAIGYYGDRRGKVLGENSKPQDGFLSNLCARWESLALEAQSPSTRVCLVRTAIVMSPNGGMLKKLLPYFERGFGAVLGDGKQYMSWISLDDMVRAILFLIDTPAAIGAFNMSAPMPVTNEMFSQLLAKRLGKKLFFKIPAWVLRLGLGARAEVMLGSCRATPQALNALGFRFNHPTLKSFFKSSLSSVQKKT